MKNVSGHAINKIKAHFESMIDMPKSDWLFFISKLEERFYSKKSIILRKGEIENMFCYLEKGSIRYFIPRSEDIEVTFGFRHEDEFSSAYDSFVSRKPSHYSLEAMEDSVLWCIEYDDLQEIYARTSVGNIIGRVFAEYNLVEKWNRELSFINQTAEERYLDIFANRPELIKKVPLKYLASYIGVTPQALSRIRKRIS